MRRLFLHLLVSLLAFFIGLSAAVLLGGTPERPARYRRTTNAIYVAPFGEVPPPPRPFSCPSSGRGYGVVPSRSMPMIPAEPPAPPPAAAAGEKEARTRSRRADGSVEVNKAQPAGRKKS
jgi:hypothetical protein